MMQPEYFGWHFPLNYGIFEQDIWFFYSPVRKKRSRLGASCCTHSLMEKAKLHLSLRWQGQAPMLCGDPSGLCLRSWGREALGCPCRSDAFLQLVARSLQLVARSSRPPPPPPPARRTSPSAAACPPRAGTSRTRACARHQCSPTYQCRHSL